MSYFALITVPLNSIICATYSIAYPSIYTLPPQFSMCLHIRPPSRAIWIVNPIEASQT